MSPKPSAWIVTRREFLSNTGLAVAGLALGTSCARRSAPQAPSGPPVLRFGMATDIHSADVRRKGLRCYRESIDKLTECVALMNEQKADFLVELGDLTDKGRFRREEDAVADLKAIEEVFAGFKGPRYHVLGNHDTDTLSKGQFLDLVENTGIPAGEHYYSFDVKGYHFVVLDANYTIEGRDYAHGDFLWRDTNIPAAELEWLKNDLAGTALPTIIFVHQQIDRRGDFRINNWLEVMDVLETVGDVVAVFQGHYHQGHHSIQGLTHYYTLRAMVDGSGEENSSYAIVDVYEDRTIGITGYRRAAGYEAPRT